MGFCIWQLVMGGQFCIVEVLRIVVVDFGLLFGYRGFNFTVRFESRWGRGYMEYWGVCRCGGDRVFFVRRSRFFFQVFVRQRGFCFCQVLLRGRGFCFLEMGLQFRFWFYFIGWYVGGFLEEDDVLQVVGGFWFGFYQVLYRIFYRNFRVFFLNFSFVVEISGGSVTQVLLFFGVR